MENCVYYTRHIEIKYFCEKHFSKLSDFIFLMLHYGGNKEYNFFFFNNNNNKKNERKAHSVHIHIIQNLYIFLDTYMGTVYIFI